MHAISQTPTAIHSAASTAPAPSNFVPVRETSPDPELRRKRRAEANEVAPNGHDFSRLSIHPPVAKRVQTKLTVSKPGDPYELEADSVAEQVMRMPEAEAQSRRAGAGALLRRPDSDGQVQRISTDESPALEDAVVVAGEEAPEEEEKTQVQTLRPLGQSSGRVPVSKSLLEGAQGGAPLGTDVRGFMEPRFGADFSGVRVHADERAASLSESLSARAFTYGRNIYFNHGEYRPETDEGRRVLAHELTHVIQQGGGRALTPGGGHAAEGRGNGLSQMVQRMGAPGPAVRQNVAPWGGTSPTGNDHEANTDGGTAVSVWIAYPIWRDNLCYWCHGHSLGTYTRFGYSVYSGSSMRAVVADEWNNVPPDQTRPGDIAVWTAGYNHSAKFERPVIENGTLSFSRSELSTKNGQSSLTTMTLAAIAGIYGSTGIAVFRHR